MGNGVLAIGPKLPRPSSTLPIVLQIPAAFCDGADLSFGQLVAFSAERLTASRHPRLTAYVAQGTGANGGGRQRNLTRRRRF